MEISLYKIVNHGSVRKVCGVCVCVCACVRACVCVFFCFIERPWPINGEESDTKAYQAFEISMHNLSISSRRFNFKVYHDMIVPRMAELVFMQIVKGFPCSNLHFNNFLRISQVLVLYLTRRTDTVLFLWGCWINWMNSHANTIKDCDAW